MLNAVLFDLDNTLIDRDQAFRDCVCHHFGDPAVRAELFRLDSGGHGDREGLFCAWRRHTGASMNQVILGRLIAERIRPDCGLLNALRVLSQTLKLGIITNGGSEIQRRKFCAAGLSEVIPHECVWVSAEVGMEKPDPAIFIFASQSLGVNPGNCLYLGDHEPDDLAGAVAAGMQARLVGAVLDAERLNVVMAQEPMP